MTAPAEEQMSMMLEGGGLKDQGGTVDPVSGNEVPDGATQEGVRDDVPAMLSEGEYVMNEASTRYHGVDKLNAMQEEAKQGYNQMEKDGLMGQPTQGAMLDDTIPFGMGDINVEDDQGQELMMADGGLVPKGFYHGGMHDERGRPIQATSGMTTLNTQNQPNRPQPSFGDSMGGFGGFTFKNYQHPDGRNMMVPFMNGVPMFSIPEGFVEFDLTNPDAVAPTPIVDPTVTPAEAVKPVEFGGGPDDPESGKPAGYDTMTPQEIFAFGNLLDKFPGGKLRDNWPGQRAAEQAAVKQMAVESKKSDARKMADLNRLAEERKQKAEEKAAAAQKELEKIKKEIESKLTGGPDGTSITPETGGTSYTAPSTPTGGTAGYSGNYNEPNRPGGPDSPPSVSSGTGTGSTGAIGLSGEGSDAAGGGPDGSPDVAGGGFSGPSGSGSGSGGVSGDDFGFFNKGGLAGKKPKKKVKTYKKGGLATSKK